MAIDTSTAESERMGFFHGKRKEDAEKTVEKILKIMEEENMSMSQAEYLVTLLKRKITEKRSVLLANTKIE